MFRVPPDAIEAFVEDVEYLWMSAHPPSSSEEQPQSQEEPSRLKSRVPRLGPPPPISRSASEADSDWTFDFLQNHVSMSRPCLIPMAVHNNNNNNNKHDSCCLTIPPTQVVQVDVSPDGHADVLRRVQAITRSDDPENGSQEQQQHQESFWMFIKPQSEEMTWEQLQKRIKQQQQQQSSSLSDINSIQERVFPLLLSPESNNNTLPNTSHPTQEIPRQDEKVYYYSRQNDCLRTELKAVWDKNTTHQDESSSSKLPRSFAWAERVFHTGPPQAVNLWYGNERSVSSMHKDPYENLLWVLQGEKTVTLCPPSDAPFLYEQNSVSVGQFVFHKGTWYVEPQYRTTTSSTSSENKEANKTMERVHWVQADVTRPPSKEFPLQQYAHPIQVTIPQGWMLYIPSLWYHRVTQSCETLAVNYWYDMNFHSPLWTYFHLLQQIKPEEPVSKQPSDEGDGTRSNPVYLGKLQDRECPQT